MQQPGPKVGSLERVGRAAASGERRMSRIGRNFSVVAAAQAITWTATFIFTLVQARLLSPAEFGELSLALSYTLLAAVLVDFGLSTKLARDVAQRPAAAGPALAGALIVRLGLWCIVMPIIWAGTVILGYHAELQAAILILGASLLIGGIGLSLTAYFQGREEFFYPSLGSVASRGSAAVLGVAALVLGHGIVAVALAYLVASVLHVLALVPGLRKHPVAAPTLDRAIVTGMFRGAAPLGLYMVFSTFYYNVDMLILQRLAPPENVAWYAAAYRLFNAAIMLVGFASATVLYPVLSRLSLGSRDELRNTMKKAFTFLLASGVFIALVLGISADHVVTLLYPAREYGEAATALRLLGPGLAAMYANGVFFIALVGMGFERRLLIMAIFLAVLNPLANVIVIPLLQQNGAALITSATELVVIVWLLALTPRDLRAAANPAVVMKICIAAIPAAACLWLLRDQTLFIGIPLAGIVYVCAALALGTVPAEDLRVIVARFGRRRADVGHADNAQVVASRTVEP
jgi:O-antigen/teichoic acid export membrane protein